MNLDEVRQIIAKREGYNSWEDMTYESGIDDEGFIDLVAKEYASQKCNEQREICAASAKIIDAMGANFDFKYPVLDRDSIINAPKPEFN